MRRRILGHRRSGGDSDIEQTDLSFRLEAAIPESYDFNANLNEWNDLIGGIKMTLVPTFSSWTKLPAEKALESDAHGETLQFNSSNYQIASGEDMTFGCYFKYSGGAGNPGFFRDGSNLFILDNGLARRPWIRLAGNDILNPSTGFQWSNTEYTYMTVAIGSHSVERPGFYSVCFDGVERYSGTHTQIMPASTLGQLLFNVVGQTLLGKWRSFQFYRKALTPSESLSNYNALLELYS